MLAYIVRRILYAIPILIGVNVITFILFFMVNTPDDMARMRLGEKRVSAVAIAQWKQQHGYDKPLFYNSDQRFPASMVDTLFFSKSIGLFSFNFGQSDEGRNIGHDISKRMWPSLALALPTFLIGIVINICFSLLLALFRGGRVDQVGVIICVILMSVSGLFYIIFGQYIVGKVMRLVPISGYQTGLAAWSFLLLPVVIGVIGSIGGGVRWYRTLFLEEIVKDYVRFARGKGLSELRVMFGHVLKNAMLPILTGIVVVIPSLFLGSLIMESFFGIPGLGSYTIDAINAQDFNIVRSMVFLGTVLYIVGLILTDISYTWFDPRVRLGR